jgi:hypothetical protein
MKFRMSLTVAIVMLSLPFAAHAQGIPDGAAHGAYVGNNTAGPVGAMVGVSSAVLLVVLRAHLAWVHAMRLILTRALLLCPTAHTA